MPDLDDKRLEVLIGGQRVGTITEGPGGQLQLRYDDTWRRSPRSLPLSLSMPLVSRDHADSAVRAYLWGLLPDSERVLERWARDYRVSARNPFALLHHVGEDCAGAAQLVPPERVAALAANTGDIEWISEDDIATRLRVLRQDPAAWHLARGGQFSLAGAQAKTALHRDPASGHWGDPWGSIPTTHILKPAISGFDDHDLNEHICLQAARFAGLRVASSQVLSFAGERAIVVQRYDRISTSAGTVARIHQEDMCQALGVLPTMKYESEGGPTAGQIVQLLRSTVRRAGPAEEDVQRFIDALAFNWLIAGTDAHAKNYSVLLADGQVRLAPLYDIASVLPYDDMYLPKLRLAMRIGGEYRIERIAGRHWRRFAEGSDLDPQAVVSRVDQLAASLPESFTRAAEDEAVQALGGRLPAVLIERVSQHVRRCRDALADS